MNILNILSSINNTIITLSYNDRVIFCKSAGNLKFKGSKKSTPYAAQKLGEYICKELTYRKIDKISIIVKGFGSGRDSILRVLSSFEKIKIIKISDKTSIPHNGCRPKKARRV